MHKLLGYILILVEVAYLAVIAWSLAIGNFDMAFFALFGAGITGALIGFALHLQKA
jgi:hypothetical protein